MRWIELAEVVQDFDGWKNLMVKEQYLGSCSVPLAVFLRERKPEDLGELARLAVPVPVPVRGRACSAP